MSSDPSSMQDAPQRFTPTPIAPRRAVLGIVAAVVGAILLLVVSAILIITLLLARTKPGEKTVVAPTPAPPVPAAQATPQIAPPSAPVATAAQIKEAFDHNDPSLIMQILESASDDLIRAQIPARQGNTPLHIAAQASNDRQLGVAEYLVSRGVDVNAPNDYLGAPAIAMAAANNNPAIVQLLLDNGANVNLADTRGRTPLDFAQYHNNQRVIALLKQAGAKTGTADFPKRQSPPPQ